MSDNSTFDSIEKAVEQAQSGNQDALEHVLRTIKKQVYSLSVRMLWHPEDAKDAAQEILLRIVTHLSTFRGDSKFSTWVYRIACNHLLNFRKSRLETAEMTFESFGEDLAEGLSDQAKVHPDDLILLQEIRVGCTLGMLLCLDRAHRIAYIIGEILELDSSEAGAILGIRPQTFRKRLERARQSIVRFMQAKCGLVDPQNQCRCHKRLSHAIAIGRVNSQQMLFASDRIDAAKFPQLLSTIRRLENAQRAVALYRSHPEYNSPEDFTAAVRRLVANERHISITER
jgi:RNA polymerase sigma factor (sigma-70 family)